MVRRQLSREGGSARPIILGLILLVVLALGAYEFAVARPKLDNATKLLNESGANITDVEVQEKLKLVPIEEKYLGEDKKIKLETYAIQRGIPFVKFRLYVWYQKSNRGLAKDDKLGEAVDTYFMKSFVANEKPDEEKLGQRSTIKIDLENTPEIAVGGGGAPPADNKKKSDDKGADDKGADDKGADDKGADDKGADDKGADDKGADDKGADDKGADDKGADDKGADDKGADDKGADDKGADDKGADDKKSDDKGADDKKSDDKGADDKGADDKGADDKKSDDKGADPTSDKKEDKKDDSKGDG